VRTLIIGEIVFGVLAMAIFAVWFGLRWRLWLSSPSGRQLMAMAATLVVVLGPLLAAGVGIPVPLWVFAIAFLAFDAMSVGWLLLLVGTEKDDTSTTGLGGK